MSGFAGGVESTLGRDAVDNKFGGLEMEFDTGS
jgi:hypothetical protein